MRIKLTVLCCIYLLNLCHAQLSLLNDEFTNSTLDTSWNIYQGQYFTASIDNGYLELDIEDNNCAHNCPWFHTQTAGFIYKNVAGDFDVTMAASAVEASGANAGDDIVNDTQLGGLMARSPGASAENYVFNVVGKRFDIASIETKSTTNGQSGTIENFNILSTSAELRMTREGQVFTLFTRPIGDSTWIHRSTFNRPDLPDTIEVGAIAYAFESYPQDLLLKIDYIRFLNLIKINEWLGGNGNWNDGTKWSLNHVPNQNEIARIGNVGPQIITISVQEDHTCHKLDVINDQTQLNVFGNLTIIVSQ